MSLVERRVLDGFEPTKTKQEFKHEHDINTILKRFKKAVGPEAFSKFKGYTDGNFGDFSNVLDYRDALHEVEKAKEVFMSLPAVVRYQFGNDTAVFLDAVQDPKNYDALVKLGLIQKREPVEAPVVKDSVKVESGKTPV